MATPRRPEPPNRMGFGGFVFILAITAGLVWLGMMIFGWGPYKEEVSLGDQTETPTLENPFQASLTPTFNITSTMAPSETPTASATPTSTTTPTPEIMPFILVGEPETMSSVLIRPELSCDYLIIAGQVWDLQDIPVTESTTVHLYGSLGGGTIDRFALPGSAPVYGESGYEFILEGLVVDSIDALMIRLEDTDGLLLSHAYPLQTYQDCQKNLILVNFKQVR